MDWTTWTFIQQSSKFALWGQEQSVTINFFDAVQNLLEEKYFILPLSGGSGEGFMDAGDEENPNRAGRSGGSYMGVRDLENVMFPQSNVNRIAISKSDTSTN